MKLNAKMKMDYETFYKLLKVFLMVTCLLQFGYIIYINLFEIKAHLGFDSSMNYRMVIESWNQKKFIIDHWQHTTNLQLDTNLPIVTIVYGITKNVFLSYGLVNIVAIVALLAAFNSVMVLLWGKSTIREGYVRYLLFNLVLCPYVAATFNNVNDLSYVSCILTGAEFYCIRMTICLLTIRIMLLLEREEKLPIISIIIVSVFCVISSIGAGYYTLSVMIMPCMLYCLVKMFVQNNIKVLFSKQSIFAMLLAGISLGGKVFASCILDFQVADGMKFVGLDKFWTNLQSIFLGFLQLVVALPEYTDTTIFSLQGIIHLFGLVIVLACIVGLFYFVKGIKGKFEEYKEYYLFVCIILSNILMFSLIYMTYGATYFEYRYLIFPYYAILFLLIFSIMKSDEKNLFRAFAVGVLSVSVVALSIMSDYRYSTTKEDVARWEEIKAKVESYDVSLVYVWGEFNDDTKKLRVLDEDTIYKRMRAGDDNVRSRWGDYTYCNEAGDYQGKYLVFCNVAEDMIPQYAKPRLTFCEQYKEYNIYEGCGTVFDYKSGFPEQGLNIDYPHSPSVTYMNMGLNESGEYVTDGTEGYVLFGPNSEVPEGTYDVTLEYEVISATNDVAGVFDLVLNEASVLIQTEIVNGSTSVTLSGVSATNQGDYLSYRIYENPGTIMKIKAIRIEKNIE